MAKTVIIIAAALLTLGLYSCTGHNNAESPDPARPVYVVSPVIDGATAARTFTAAVEEGKSVNVSFKTGGQIKRLSYKEGDRVAKGAVMGQLDDSDYRLQLQQVQTQYTQVAAEVGRLEEMYRRNNIAPNDYEKAKAGLEQLKTQLDLVKNQLAYTRLEAPASGYIVEKYMEEGEMTGAGTPVYKILDNTGLEASVALPSSVYARKGEIASCIGRSSATGNTDIPLRIISFIPEGDNNALFRLRLRIPSEYRDRLLPGMNMTVALNFASGEGPATFVVPSRAIFQREGKEYVWVVSGAEETSVKAKEVERIGLHKGEKSVVTGLDGNETLVAAGVHHLSENAKVRVAGDIKNLKKEGPHD